MGGSGSSFSSKKEPSVEGLEYSADLEEFKRINAQDEGRRRRIIDWTKKNHKKVEDLYYEAQEARLNQLAQNAKEIDYDEAFRIINDNIRQSDGRGWFVDANSDYKPRIFSAIMSNPEVLNAGWNVAYMHYKWQVEENNRNGGNQKTLSFRQWLRTPQTYYRGSTSDRMVSSDRWVSYTNRQSIANRFATQAEGARVSYMKIRPMETLGSYQDTGEAETFIPRWKVKK